MRDDVIIDLVLGEPLRLLANSIDAARILMRPRLLRLTPPRITHGFSPSMAATTSVRRSDGRKDITKPDQ
jgi:hypothetical protein